MSTNEYETRPAEKTKQDNAVRQQLADDLGYLLARYWLDCTRGDAKKLSPRKPPRIRSRYDGSVR